MSDNQPRRSSTSRSRSDGARTWRTLFRVANVVSLAALMTTIIFLATTGPGEDGSAAATPAVPDWAPSMAAYFLGAASSDDVQLVSWESVETATGERIVSEVAGEGLVQFDPASHEVNEVIWSARLSGATGPLVEQLDAVRAAQSYAGSHYLRFEDLVMRSVETLDHGAFAEYRVLWQARDGEAWLPSQVAIGVNARTGQLAYYFSERVDPQVDTTPLTTAAQASAAALEVAAVGPGATAGAPELTVVVEGGRQSLQWVVQVRAPHQAEPHIVSAPIVWVDAHTGVARVAAVAA